MTCNLIYCRVYGEVTRNLLMHINTVLPITENSDGQYGDHSLTFQNGTLLSVNGALLIIIPCF